MILMKHLANCALILTLILGIIFKQFEKKYLSYLFCMHYENFRELRYALCLSFLFCTLGL